MEWAIRHMPAVFLVNQFWKELFNPITLLKLLNKVLIGQQWLTYLIPRVIRRGKRNRRNNRKR
mgnify:CR=1 FL=1